MSLEITGGTELQRCVQRLVDADLILAGDGEALLDAAGEQPGSAQQLERLLWLLETLVSDGDVTAGEAAPALFAVRRALRD